MVAIGSVAAFAWDTPVVTGTCPSGTTTGFTLKITTNDSVFAGTYPASEHVLVITDTTKGTSTTTTWTDDSGVLYSGQVSGSTSDKWTVSFPGILDNGSPQSSLQNVPVDLSGCKCQPTPSPSPSATPTPTPTPTPSPKPSASPTPSPTPTPGGGLGAGTPSLPDTGFGG